MLLTVFKAPSGTAKDMCLGYDKLSVSVVRRELEGTSCVRPFSCL